MNPVKKKKITYVCQYTAQQREDQQGGPVEFEADKMKQGCFSKAYFPVGKNYVVIYTKDSNDPSKEMLAMFLSGRGYTHIPECTYLGWCGDYSVYKMPIYKPLTAKSKNWLLWKSFNRVVAATPKQRYYIDFARNVVDALQDEWPEKELEELERLLEEGNNYGDTLMIDNKKTAFMVDDNDNLIFLDMLFNIELLKEKWNRNNKL
jgi:hypothetical protein